MTLTTTLQPVPPYSLAASARLGSDATRRFRDGVLALAYEAEGEPALAHVWQRRDGDLDVRLETRRPDAALAHLRFILAVDDGHAPFLTRFRDDPLLAPAIRRFPGMRPLRVATLVHALLKAVCGQLIQVKSARLLEDRLVRLAAPEHGGFRLPPTRTTFSVFSPADLGGHGLVARKATALLRLSGEADLERLRTVATPAALARIERERGLGPWSAGMICLYGLGRFDGGLVGDLGLVKICAARLGRWATADDTRELLEPYGEWAGLASAYLLASPATRDARGAARAGAPRRAS